MTGELIARYASGPRKGQTIHISPATAEKMLKAKAPIEVLGTVEELAKASKAEGRETMTINKADVGVVHLGVAGEKGN